jgi:hypothetical protein
MQTEVCDEKGGDAPMIYIKATAVTCGTVIKP